MEIKRVRLRPLSVPLKGELLHSGGTHPSRFVITLFEVETDSGLTGYGEGGGGGFSFEPFAKMVSQGLVGEDPLNIKKLRYKIASPITSTYYNQLLPQIWFPIETALMDIKGKHVGQPIHNLLGGKLRDDIEFSAYVFPTDHTIGVDEFVKHAESIIRSGGFSSIKIKTGVFSPQHEVDTVKAAAEKFSGARFRIDPNGGWNLSQAVWFSKKLDGISIEYFEDPVWTMEGLRSFKELSGHPVATNTVITRFEDIPHAFIKRAVDVILGDPHWWYGMNGFLELAASAWSLGLEVGIHSPGETGLGLSAVIHVAATTPNLSYAADTHYIHLADDILKTPLAFERGSVRVSDGIGLGVEIDENKVQKYEELYRDQGDYVYHRSSGDGEVITIPRKRFAHCTCHSNT
jgi:glucarate dehydratase